jgi:hypothetical protein
VQPESRNIAVPARVRLGSKSDGHESGRRDAHSALSSQVHSNDNTFLSFSRNVPRSVRCGNPKSTVTCARPSCASRAPPISGEMTFLLLIDWSKPFSARFVRIRARYSSSGHSKTSVSGTQPGNNEPSSIEACSVLRVTTVSSSSNV